MPDDILNVKSVGKVVAMDGEVRAASDGNVRQLSPGSEIFQGDTLSTGPDARLEVLFQDDTTLAMGAESRINISSYVYDSKDPSASDLLFQMSKGVFRTVTGEIAEQNPDQFKLKSPLVQIGIRGTTVVSEVRDLTEKHGVEDIGPGKVLVVMDNMGNIQFIDNPGLIIDIFQNQAIQPARPLTEAEENYFRSTTPMSHDTDGGTEDDQGDQGDPEDQAPGDDPGDEASPGESEEDGQSPSEENAETSDIVVPEALTYTVLGIIDTADPDGAVFYAAASADEDGGSSEDTETDTDPGELFGVDYDETEPDPVAVSDTGIIEENASVTLDVLANDTDPDGDDLAIVSVTQGRMGTVTINEDNTITYVPEEDASGTDVFTYTVEDDGGGQDSAIVTITIRDTTNDPVAVDDSGSTESGTAVVLDVLSNDTDADGDDLTVASVTQGSLGTVSINADNTLTYTPGEDAAGTDTFTYTVSDGSGGTATGTVTVTVSAPENQAPVAVDDSGIAESGTAVVLDVLSNDTDADGDDLAVASVTQGSLGTVSINSDNTLTYTPAEDAAGTDTFTYTVSDGISGGTSTGTVTVTVNEPTNQAPVAVDDSGSTESGATVVLDVLSNDTDADGDDLTVQSVTQGSLGTVGINADNTLTYTPAEDAAGTDTFTYTVSDGISGGTSTGTVTITVNEPANQAPVAVDDSGSTESGTAVVLDVLSNDTDADGDDLIVASVTQGSLGTVSINADDTLTYTPGEDAAGTDTFTYTVSDGISGGMSTGIVTVTVNEPPNQAPVAADDSGSTESGTAVVLDVLSNDTDADGDDLTVSSVTQGSLGTVSINADNTLTYTPGEDAAGTDTFTYTVSDGSGGTATGTVTVTVNEPPNQAPVAADDSGSTESGTAVVLDVLSNDTDADGDDLTVSSVTQGSLGTVGINADNTLTYTPGEDAAGTDTFTYTVSDGISGGTSTGTVTITVNEPANQAPVAADDSGSTESGTAVVLDVLSNDTDADGDDLTVSSVTQGSLGTVGINADNTLTYTPGEDAVGTDTFTYTVSDGSGGTSIGTVTVTVNEPPNQAPVAADDSGSTESGTAVVLDVLSNDTDEDGDDLTVSSVTQGSLGTVSINADNTLTYTPGEDTAGTDTFTYTVSDGSGGTSTGTVTVTVSAPENQAPVAVDDSGSTESGTAVVLDVLSNDTDEDGDDLTVASVTQGSLGTVSINADNTLTYTPGEDAAGTDTFTYTVSDGIGGTATGTVTVTVSAPENQAPVAVDDSGSTESGTAVVLDVLSNDTDADGDDLTVASVTQGSLGAVSINADNTLTYTSGVEAAGTDTFTYTVSDGIGGTATGTVTVTVSAPENQAPVAVDDSGSTESGTAVVLDVLSNDTDADGDDLTVASVTQGSLGAVSINADNTLTYTPDAGSSGTDTFTYTVSDGSGGTSTGTVTVTITAGDDENITGTSGSDTLYGYAGNDTVSGKEGDDTIYGDTPEDDTVSGNDSLYGGDGDDFLQGGPGNDTIYGEGGDDKLAGGQGDDFLDGGDGYNSVSYQDDDDDDGDGYGVSGGISFTWSGGAGSFSGSYVTDGWGTKDTLTDIYEIFGSDYNDSLTVQVSDVDGDHYSLWSLWGGQGDDTLTGTAGEWVAAVYYSSTSGVTINLGGGYASDGWGGNDTLVDIQVAIGSTYNDTIIGSDVDDGFYGTLGDDYIDGGDGTDFLSYSWMEGGTDDFSAVEVKLSEGVVYGRDAALDIIFTDTITNIEEVQGSDHNDTMSGTSGSDRFFASMGDDSIDGMDSDTDAIEFSHMTGEDGFDHAEVDLSANVAYGVDSGGTILFKDYLINVEDVYGSDGDDEIRGSTADNLLSGGNGNDTLNGDTDGLDSLTGGKGADVFEFVEYSNPDYVTDFSTDDADVLRFTESDLGSNFSADGTVSVYTATATGTVVDPTQYQVIGITDAIADWSVVFAVADFIDSAVEGSNMTDGDTDDTYFLIHNGTDTRVYYWDGDEDLDQTVDTEELEQIATLQGVDTVADFSDSNFEFT